MSREDLFERIVIAFGSAYCLICFTAVLHGFLFGQNPPGGYLVPIWYGLYHIASSFSDPILRFFFRAITVGLFILFIPGLFGGMLLFLAILLVLLIPGLIVGLGVSLAHVSITGAIIVFAIIGIVFTVLIRKYWEPIVEAWAWVVVLSESLQHRSQARHTMAAVAVVGGEGNLFMAKSSDGGELKRGDREIQNRGMEVPGSVFENFKRKIRTRSFAQALEAKITAARLINDLGDQEVRGVDISHELDTKIVNKKLSVKQKEFEIKDLQQTVELERQRDALDEVLANREKRNQPQVPPPKPESRSEKRRKLDRECEDEVNDLLKGMPEEQASERVRERVKRARNYYDDLIAKLYQ